MRVERASWSDVPWIIQECMALSEYHNADHITPEGPYAEWRLRKYIDEGQLVLVCYNNAHERVGFLLAFTGQHLFREMRTLSCALWWVARKYKHTSAAARLLAAFDEHARRFDYVTFTLVDGVGGEALRRRGYTPGDEVWEKAPGKPPLNRGRTDREKL